MQRSRRGIARYEVLAIIGMIFVLCTLLVPAIFMAREASRRSQCGNNLNRLGQALFNYHTAHRVYPPGMISEPGCLYTATENAGRNTISSASAFTLLLPFLGEQPTYARYNFSLGCAHDANITSVAASLNIFLCPSNIRTPFVAANYYRVQAGATDYVLSLGANAMIDCGYPHLHLTISRPPSFPFDLSPGTGAFNVNLNCSQRSFRDGLGSSFMLGEGAGGLMHGRTSGSDYGGEAPNELDAGAVVEQAWSQGFLPGPGGLGGYGSVFAATAYDAWYDHMGRLVDQEGPNGWLPIPMNQSLHALRGTAYAHSWPLGPPPPYYPVDPPVRYHIPVNTVSVSPFRSLHKGQCQFLFGDGAVRTLQEDIDVRVYVALSTIAGKEPLPSNDKFGGSPY